MKHSTKKEDTPGSSNHGDLTTDDDLSSIATSKHSVIEGGSAPQSDPTMVGAQEQRRVNLFKRLMILVLLGVAGAMAALVHRQLKQQEQDEFEREVRMRNVSETVLSDKIFCRIQ